MSLCLCGFFLLLKKYHFTLLYLLFVAVLPVTLQPFPVRTRLSRDRLSCAMTRLCVGE